MVTVLVGIFGTSTGYFYPCSRPLPFCIHLKRSIYSNSHNQDGGAPTKLFFECRSVSLVRIKYYKSPVLALYAARSPQTRVRQQCYHIYWRPVWLYFPSPALLRSPLTSGVLWMMHRKVCVLRDTVNPRLVCMAPTLQALV